MRLPVTQKLLIDWAGSRVFRDAELLVESGRVLEVKYEEPLITGALLWNNRAFNTSLEIMSDGNVVSHCPCRDNTERGIICAHVIALGIVLVRAAADPQREAKRRAEQRRADRVAATDESDYIRRDDSDLATVAELKLAVESDWNDQCRRGSTTVRCDVRYGETTCPVDEVPRDMSLSFSKDDESLLYVLEDISEGPAQGRLCVNRFDFLNIVELLAGNMLHVADADPVTVNQSPMSTFLRMELDRETGGLVVEAHTELPFIREGDPLEYVVTGRSGWVCGAHNLWPLENVLPEPYHALYDGPIRIDRSDVLRFVRQELPTLEEAARIESDITPDLFTIEPAVPGFKLVMKGSPASLAAVLYCTYGDIEIVANKPDPQEHFGLPDPDDIMRYLVRNKGAERAAVDTLCMAGFHGEIGDALDPIVGERGVLNFLGSSFPSLRRRGWRVEVEGRIEPYFESMNYVAPVVHINDAATGWFDVGFDFEDSEGESLSQSDIQRALRMGDSYVERGGRTYLLDSDAVTSMMDIFSDCASGESDQAGQFRLSDIYAPFVKSSLDALDGVDVESKPDWLNRAGKYNREMKLTPVPVGDDLEGVLRPYQKDGVSWLRFLEQNGFCGLLADEMGLGKTLQALTWLRMQRIHDHAQGRPALIVCPTSLVENWIEEGAKFAPQLEMMSLTGSDRHEKWERVPDVGVVVTSYALLRRDIDKYLEHHFSVAVLDEAQHIKNRSTQNALSAKMVRASHKLVLTGTPIENSVSDLWSIMDFLMPSYLGHHDDFRNLYEVPLSKGGPDAESAQIRLRRKMQPFLLRRLRVDVAKDLPPKIEKVAHCTLTRDQRAVYNEILKTSKRKVADMVGKKGFNKSRMEILTMLMRLRQVCCHLDLLKMEDLKKAKYPSAKMEMYFELLDEALDGGHRMLVFSQFVSMLKILRAELDRRGLNYCYLDGSTKDRMAEVKRFNTDRSVPVFLISLKAGGTGLNLVGADMVIHFDPWWNPAVEDQATDRAYRIGQKRTVYATKLIAKDTVEEKVVELQKKKKAIINATLETDEKMIQSMTWDDIQHLLDI